MIKTIALAYRKEGMTRQEYSKYWREIHAPLAERMIPNVKKYVQNWPETRQFLERYLSLLDFLLPLYEKEGKSYLNIAVGCTGGRHRSVAVAQWIFEHLQHNNRNASLIHRDINIPA